MAEDKNSFLFYTEWIETFEALEDDEAGKLIKHLLRYVNDQNPECDSKIINIAFTPIKQTLKRDLKKWESIVSKRSEAGKQSAINKAKQKATKPTSVESVKTNSTKSTVSENVSVNVNEINTQGVEFNFSFVEESFKIPFRSWFKYKTEIKKPFKLQQAIEACYRELKEMSGNHPLEAMKIVQYSISNEYLSLCKPTGKTDKKEEKQVYVPPKKFVHK